MEKKKLKEIEAKLSKLLTEIEKANRVEEPPQNKFNGAKVIRRRKGQMDLHFT